MKRKKVFEDNVPVSVLLPAKTQLLLAKIAAREERSFSSVIRRAVRREVGLEKKIK
jgi:hypothetical protein